MRFLPALLLFVAPLLAQEPSEEELRAKAIEQMRAESAQLRARLEELRSRSAATRERAMEAIKRANATVDELLPLFAEMLQQAKEMGAAGVELAGGARTLYLGAVGSEAISGSADGTDYTLKSLGDGKYELSATKRDEDGKVMEETKDQGTLKELQEKYAFLRSGLAIQIPAAPMPMTLRGRVVDAYGRALGEPVVQWGDSTFWGGGGKVGVMVVEPSDDLRFHLQLPEGAGFIVQQVVPGSRAEQIGIRRMDVLLKLDDELIDSPVQLKKLHEKKGVLEIIRRSETRKIDLATVQEGAAAAPTATDAPTAEPSGQGR